MELWELRKEPHLSSSSINDYCECGILYKFGRVDRIPIEGKSDALEFGTVIHLVLAEYYEEKMVGNKLSIKEVHSIFEEYWRDHAEDNDDIQYTKDNNFNSILLMGKELLTIWHNKLPDDDFHILGIEKAFQFHLPGISVPLIGAMDLIEEDESGCLIITDFKTSSRAYSASEIDGNAQLTLYQLAAKENFSDREILLRFDTLIKTKTPKFEQYWTTRSEVDEKRLIKKITQAWDGISKGVFIPNDGSWKCKNCFYRQACDEWFLEEAA